MLRNSKKGPLSISTKKALKTTFSRLFLAI
jgi:hypothetical protein